MKRQAFQRGEIRDEDDNIIRTGAYGKNTAFATKDNKGILDYIINNFDALIDLITGMSIYADSKSEFPSTGVIGKRYIARDTGKIYTWDEEKSSYLELAEENKEYLTKDEADRIYAAQTALNSYLPLTGGTTTGKVTFNANNLNKLPEINKISDDLMAGIRFSSKSGFLGGIGKRKANGEDIINLRSDNSVTDVVLDSRNYNTYVPSKTGTGASGTWNINISGTAAKATNDSDGNNIVNTYLKKSDYKSFTLPTASATVLGGMVVMYAGSDAPTGWLVCDGSEVSKTTYASLYEIVGDAYGTPTDTGNFLLPNLSKLAGVMYIIKAIPTSDGVQVTI